MKSPAVQFLEQLHMLASMTLGGSALTCVGVIVYSLAIGQLTGGEVFFMALAVAIGSTFVTSTIQRLLFGGRRRTW